MDIVEAYRQAWIKDGRLSPEPDADEEEEGSLAFAGWRDDYQSVVNSDAIEPQSNGSSSTLMPPAVVTRTTTSKVTDVPPANIHATTSMEIISAGQVSSSPVCLSTQQPQDFSTVTQQILRSQLLDVIRQSATNKLLLSGMPSDYKLPAPLPKLLTSTVTRSDGSQLPQTFSPVELSGTDSIKVVPSDIERQMPSQLATGIQPQLTITTRQPPLDAGPSRLLPATTFLVTSQPPASITTAGAPTFLSPQFLPNDPLDPRFSGQSMPIVRNNLVTGPIPPALPVQVPASTTSSPGQLLTSIGHGQHGMNYLPPYVGQNSYLPASNLVPLVPYGQLPWSNYPYGYYPFGYPQMGRGTVASYPPVIQTAPHAPPSSGVRFLPTSTLAHQGSSSSPGNTDTGNTGNGPDNSRDQPRGSNGNGDRPSPNFPGRPPSPTPPLPSTSRPRVAPSSCQRCGTLDFTGMILCAACGKHYHLTCLTRAERDQYVDMGYKGPCCVTVTSSRQFAPTDISVDRQSSVNYGQQPDFTKVAKLIPEFDGSPSQSFDHWKVRVEMTFDRMPGLSDADKAFVVSLRLKGPPLMQWQNYPWDIQTNYHLLMKSLSRHYPSTARSAFDVPPVLYKQKGQRVSEYATLLLAELNHRITPQAIPEGSRDRIKMCQFIGGLTKLIGRFVYVQNPATYDEAFDLAIRFEQSDPQWDEDEENEPPKRTATSIGYKPKMKSTGTNPPGVLTISPAKMSLTNKINNDGGMQRSQPSYASVRPPGPPSRQAAEYTDVNVVHDLREYVPRLVEPYFRDNNRAYIAAYTCGDIPIIRSIFPNGKTHKIVYHCVVCQATGHTHDNPQCPERSPLTRQSRILATAVVKENASFCPLCYLRHHISVCPDITGQGYVGATSPSSPSSKASSPAKSPKPIKPYGWAPDTFQEIPPQTIGRYQSTEGMIETTPKQVRASQQNQGVQTEPSSERLGLPPLCPSLPTVHECREAPIDASNGLVEHGGVDICLADELLGPELQRIFIPVHFHGHQATTLLDTGSTRSMVSQSWFQRHFEKNDVKPVIHPIDFGARSVSGHIVNMIGMVFITIRIGQSRLSNRKIYIVHDFGYDALIGNDLLSDFQISIAYPSKRVFLRHEEVPTLKQLRPTSKPSTETPPCESFQKSVRQLPDSSKSSKITVGHHVNSSTTMFSTNLRPSLSHEHSDDVQEPEAISVVAKVLDKNSMPESGTDSRGSTSTFCRTFATTRGKTSECSECSTSSNSMPLKTERSTFPKRTLNSTQVPHHLLGL